MPIVECVPNFSEGRRQDVVDRIVAAITAVPGVSLLGAESDPDHNRSVITLAGEPEAVLQGAFEGCKTAAALIDLRQHKGEHPRMGATDVIPFVPISGITMAECIELADRLGQRIGTELGIPVFMYAEAAKRPERANLADVRAGEFEGLREEIGRNSHRTPDYGPEKIHESAGATAVGARFFLIAYNVNLDTRDVKLAKRIAKAIREKDGGMPAVKAMGFDLPAENCVQVSMNLVDYRKTSPAQVFQRIAELAEAEGVQVKNSEIVGLMPQEALELCARQMMESKKLRSMEGAGQIWLNQFAAETLKLKDFVPDEQVIELKLEDFMASDLQQFPYLAGVNDFLRDLASDKPTPGGGAAAAVLGATGIALGEMVGNLTIGRKKYADVQDIIQQAMAHLTPMRDRMLTMFAEDARAFEAFGEAGKLPKDTDEQKAARGKAMQEALKNATLTPDQTAALGVEAFKHLFEIAKVGNKHAISDCGVGALSLYACIKAAVQNMWINLPGIKDEDFKGKYTARANEYEKEAQRLLDETLKVVRAAIGG
ncbi:MAG: glutamate formimidoyltransferase [Planctomycetes bacterium]|nr:glutamate formimidoyltransferase [Planctomycetota bacterium]MCW8135005.1 glutamate formimidoyltransferase [Planctomycetota bacterium]